MTNSVRNASGQFTGLKLIGHTFGRLLVLENAGVKNGKTIFLCQCQCGNQVIVRGTRLTGGTTKSCGCLAKELTIQRSKTHGHSTASQETPTYRSWHGMKQRCNNPNSHGYQRYGGRGIAVCKGWETFDNFLIDMGDRPTGTSLDRINNELGYSPDNCRWASVLMQQRNKSNSLIINGMCLKDHAEQHGVSYGLLWKRIRTNWELKKALTTPSRKRRKQNVNIANG